MMKKNISRIIIFTLLASSLVTGYLAMSKTGLLLTLSGQEAATPENLLSYEPFSMLLFFSFSITFFAYVFLFASLHEEGMEGGVEDDKKQ